VSADASTPWDSDALLPEAPVPGTYGFLLGRKWQTCSREELIERCSRRDAFRTPIAFVYTPDSPRVLPVTEVPFLAPAVESRLGEAFNLAVFNVASGSLIAFTTYAIGPGKDGRSLWPMWFVIAIIPGLQSLYDVAATRRARRPLLDQPPPWPRDVAARFAFWISSRPARATTALAIAIAAVGLGQLWAGAASVEAAGLVKPAVRAGEVWRLLTAGVLHGSVWHFIGNMAALIALGGIVEHLTDWSRMALVFLVSVAVGGVFSMVLLPDLTSVGASGGILGLLGFLVVVGLRLRPRLPQHFRSVLVQGILWVTLTGLVAYQLIDNAAHLGGLLAGLALGVLLLPRGGTLPLPGTRRSRTVGALCLAGSLLAAVASLALMFGALT
jgi:membrane associated rhomboid family serine protease